MCSIYACYHVLHICMLLCAPCMHAIMCSIYACYHVLHVCMLLCAPCMHVIMCSMYACYHVLHVCILLCIMYSLYALSYLFYYFFYLKNLKARFKTRVTVIHIDVLIHNNNYNIIIFYHEVNMVLWTLFSNV